MYRNVMENIMYGHVMEGNDMHEMKVAAYHFPYNDSID